MIKNIFRKYCLLPILAGLFSGVAAGSAQATAQPHISDHNINFATGNKYLSRTDYRLDSPGLPLSFTRTYNSQSTANLILGHGWIATGLEHLQIAADTITFVQSGSRHVYFYNDGQGNWINEAGMRLVITATGGGYLLTEPDSGTRTFDAGGKLLGKSDKNSNTLTYGYTGADLSSISDNFGHTLSFTYTGGKLTTLTTPVGDYTYRYANDNLTSAAKPDGTSNQYLYDDPNDPHNLTGIIDENNARILTVSYDDQDRATSSAFTNNHRQVTIAYQPNLQRVITNSLGVETTYLLEARHGIALVTSFSGPGCSSCGDDSSSSYTYNDQLQVLTQTNGRSITTSYEYDNRGNRTQETEAVATTDERITTWSYEPNSSRIATETKKSVVDPAQNTITAYAYDPNGNIHTITRTGRVSGGATESVTTTYTHDALGHLVTIDGPRTDVSDITTFTYYPNEESQGLNRGELQKITNPLLHETIFANYNGLGLPQTITPPEGTTTQITYNSSGQRTSVTTAGLTTSYQYYPNGQIHIITAPGSRSITYTYTPAGDLASMTDGQGNSISYTYDSEGNMTREDIHDPANTLTAFTRYAYKDSGHLDRIIYPDNSFTGYDYDQTGNLTSLINAVTKTTGFAYDALDRLTQITQPGSTITGQGYDGHDNLTSVGDPASHTTSYTYDDLGHRVNRSSADTGITANTYDPAGNVMQTTNHDGVTITYHYDAANRLTAVDLPGAPGAESFTYDDADRLHATHDSSGEITYSHDALGRVTSMIRTLDGQTYTTGYHYAPVTGDLTSITYPTGTVLNYSRDSLGRISGLSADSTPLLDAITYAPFGPMQTAALSGSFVLTRTLDLRYNISRIQAAALDYQYNRDPEGRVTTITGIEKPALTTDSISYTYQTDSSRLQSSTGTSTKNYTTSPSGNITSDGTFTYTYDALNRLSRASQNGTTIAEYGYDPFNRRIKKTVAGKTIHYHYDLQNNLIAETDLAGNPICDYFYANGEPLGLKSYGAHAGTYYFINDHLGTPQQLVDGSGNTVWETAYLPYGKTQSIQASITNNLRFPGQYYDAETGLHYNWHRYYEPSTGRYLTPDPIGLAGGINLYSYSYQNPINYFDPTGLDVWHIINSKAVAGRGHAGGIVGQGNNFTYHSFGPEHAGRPIDSGQYEEKSFSSLKDATNYAKGLGYDLYARYPSSIETDEKARQAARRWAGDKYHGTAHNCQDMVNDMMDAGEYGDLWMDPNWPNMNYLKNLSLSSENGPIR